LRCSGDLQFKCIFHKQSGTGSESEITVKAESGSKIEVKAGSGSEKKVIPDPQHTAEKTFYTLGMEFYFYSIIYGTFQNVTETHSLYFLKTIEAIPRAD
jgi:hypothetical protein